MRFILLLILCSVSASAKAAYFTQKQARPRAAEAIKADDPYPVLLRQQAMEKDEPAFYWFDEINPDPKISASAHIRFLAVNRSNGEVWDVGGVSCALMLPAKIPPANKTAPKSVVRPAWCEPIEP